MLPELWCYVIEFLDCDDICYLNLVNKYFYQICTNNGSYMKRKMKGFPRSTGHCGNHEVFEFDFVKKFYSENHTREEEVVLFEKTVTKLKAMKADLVRGDLILYPDHQMVTRHGLRMYDGHKIIDLDYQYITVGQLPAKFKVINDSVPIHYWRQERQNIGGWLYNIGERGIHLNNCVWFNHSSVKQQCFDNIINKEGKIYTTFTYAEKDYTLFYIGSDGEEKFKHCLRKEQLLLCISPDKNKLGLPYIHDYYK